MAERSHDHSGVREYLAVLRRRKWILLGAVIAVPAIAVALSMQQTPLYQGTAQVLLGHLNLATSLTGQQDLTPLLDPGRLAETEANVAAVPTVAKRVLDAEGLSDRTPVDFLSQSSATAKPNADILDFSVTDPDQALAGTLATEYAKQFTAYRHELDTAALSRARQEVEQKLDQLEATGEQKSQLYATLAGKEQELRTMEALQTSNAFVVREAGTATKVRPRPVRDGMLGLLLGLFIGIALVLLREALDVRVRTSDSVADRLGLSLIARVPRPQKEIAKRDGLVMLDKPNSNEAEAFRMMRTNFDFVNLERGARTVMVTSALEGEGKSTTVANLAIALARAGKRVILVDGDLRRPYLHKFFDLEDAAGITQVALGLATLDEALTPISISTQPTLVSENGSAPRVRSSANGAAPVLGTLEVIGCGPIPPNPGEFIGTAALQHALEELATRCDILLLDSPPLLGLGDGLTLSTRVDGILVVVNLSKARRPVLNELKRVLDSCGAASLGFVVTDAASEEGYGYGYYYGRYGYRSRYYRAGQDEEQREAVPEPPGGRLR